MQYYSFSVNLAQFFIFTTEICPVTWHHVIDLRTCDIEHVIYWHGNCHMGFIKLLLCTVFYIHCYGLRNNAPSISHSERESRMGWQGGWQQSAPMCLHWGAMVKARTRQWGKSSHTCIWGEGEAGESWWWGLVGVSGTVHAHIWGRGDLAGRKKKFQGARTEICPVTWP